jgi:glutamyl-tRNA synthetase
LQDYQAKGYLPDALVNYLVRLGWAHGDQEIFTRDELVAAFRLERVGSAPGVFDHAKLDWLNALWIRQTPAARLADLVEPFWVSAGVDPTVVEARGRAWLGGAIPLFVERAKTLVDLARAMAFLFARSIVVEPKAAEKFLTARHLANLAAVRRVAAETADFSSEGLEQQVRALVEQGGGKLIDYAQPIRVALTGRAASPPIFPVLVLLGREAVLARLDGALGAR